MGELPSGTVTFLFTDVEGSTRLLKQVRERYGQVLAEHQLLLRDAFAAQGGEVIDTQGDSFFVAFRRARQAVAAAAQAQNALAGHEWPEGVELRVRMGIHTGEAELEGGRYHGVAVHRAARIGAAAHGGQVLCSQTTHEVLQDEETELPGVSLRDLGLQRLKDMERPVRLYQLVINGLPSKFPPLRTLGEVKERGRRRTLLVGAMGGVIAAAVAIPIFALGGGSGGSAALASIGANAVGAIDPSTGRIAASIPVETSPTAVAVGEGAVWVANANDDSVSRIDPKTNASVQTIAVGSGPSGVAVGGGFVWVANSLGGTVSKIDPNVNNGTVVDTLRVGNAPAGIAFGEGGVWVANSADRSVVRIDPRTGAVGRPIAVDAGADAIAVGAGAVWAASESAGSVTRIDPRSGSVQASINVGNGPAAVSVGAGSVWVANGSDGTVARIDPASNAVKDVITVGEGPAGLAVAPDGKAVWVSNELGGTLSRIDPTRERVDQTIEAGNRPEGIAIAGDTMYVAVRTSGLTHVGGTLTVASSGYGAGEATQGTEADLIDLADYSALWYLLTMTNDGLTGYQRGGGGEVVRLVADLAKDLPSPTDGGRTYTFQLRTGIHYSTGAPVRPEDFRRAIWRALTWPGSYIPGYYTGIVGAAACTAKHCDLTKGIVADPRSNTVTFHLTGPDPDFLYKLAVPTAYAVPASTPLKARLPLPATGPYRIASYDARHRVIRLVRNARFHEWSAAAQPNGYPDEIDWKFGLSNKNMLRVIERGRADLTDTGISPELVPALRTRYASWLHHTPEPVTVYVWLNTRLPPFDDVRARRAVNFAIDRNHLIALAGGLYSARLSCQVLPPNLDGYQRYCPYTTDPRAGGSYTGPDLARAKKLVAASGTRGQPVTVWFLRVPIGIRDGSYFVSVLKSLGYKARLKTCIPGKHCYLPLADPRGRRQAAIGAWAADFASADDFFSPLLTCASFKPGSATNSNAGAFCNPRIDAEIGRARALQTSDPHAASQLWSKIDRDITDQAPWVVVRNGVESELVSPRVGNYGYCFFYGVCLDQLWVR